MTNTIKSELESICFFAGRKLTNNGSRRTRIVFLMERETLHVAKQMRAVIYAEMSKHECAGNYDRADSIRELLDAADEVISEKSSN